jgi:hydrogenase-4 membrane subunit HyfE
MTRKYWLAVLAYVVPTFPLGYLWHLVWFKTYYEALQVYRADIIIPFGILSMLIQGCAWAFIYSRLFAGETVLMGAAKFMALALPLAWTFLVIVVAAKHQMTSVSGFVLIETGFTLLQYLVVSPLIALSFSDLKLRSSKPA